MPVSDLQGMLSGMEPTLHVEPYVYLIFSNESPPSFPLLGPGGRAIIPFAQIAEDEEGTTLIVRRAEAEALNRRPDFVARRITLKVHSALQGVGLTAAVSARLTQLGISCNVIAAGRHDHLFVDVERGEDALEALRRLSQEAREG
ncbi:hypothetical protein IE81DRAFT_325859 [Ceraceosorus guamensis]|uniref:Aspartate kinase n=1 Tax=Ceraceosorus guamensis TaxID=1522189 RepID=A0A316VUN0_9BASI|nr:hypothetical protein IE81DRAFT_325859 [Ceraceosorus guamensis]PWN40153.1 hypothetical protein IE81DRAFT_325859 [Ceraceosorus guamensis]